MLRATLAATPRAPAAPAPKDDPRDALLRMAMGRWLPPALHAAAVLGLADHLASGPRSLQDLAQASGAHAPALRRLVRALASVGVFEELGQGLVGLTPLADPLRSGAPGSLRALVIHHGSPPAQRAWERLPEALRTGADPLIAARGDDSSGDLAQHPRGGDLPDEAAAGHLAATAPALLGAVDLTGVRKVVEVGGGRGALLASLLRANPDLAGVVFDLPRAAEAAREFLRTEGFAGRAEAMAGDASEGVPGGGDLYVASLALQGWSDARAAAVLRSVRAAMGPRARLVVVDWVVPPGRAQHPGKVLDLELLAAGSGGRVRSLAEHRSLLEGAGLRLARVLPLPTGASVLEAEPAGQAGP